MPMAVPSMRVDIDFNVAASRGLVIELHHGTAKIRAAFAIEKTRMKNAHFPSRGRDELVAQHALMLPHGLQKPFGWRFVAFVECGHAAAVKAKRRV